MYRKGDLVSAVWMDLADNRRFGHSPWHLVFCNAVVLRVVEYEHVGVEYHVRFLGSRRVHKRGIGMIRPRDYCGLRFHDEFV